VRAPRTAFKLIPGASHSGATQGIMAAAPAATIDAVLRCLRVADRASYTALCDAFDAENAQRDADKVELEPVGPFPPRVHIHDPRSLLIVRLADEAGEPLPDTRFLLAAGTPANPDWMPRGFMLDRQANSRAPAVVSFFLDYSLLAGDSRVADPRNSRQTLRPVTDGRRPYTALIQPTIVTGLVHHLPASTVDDLFAALGPHRTTVLDVVLPRKVHEGVFRLTQDFGPEDFRKPDPGAVIG